MVFTDFEGIVKLLEKYYPKYAKSFLIYRKQLTGLSFQNYMQIISKQLTSHDQTSYA